MTIRDTAGSVEPAGEGRIRVKAGNRAFLVAAKCPHRDGLLLYGYVNRGEGSASLPTASLEL